MGTPFPTSSTIPRAAASAYHPILALLFRVRLMTSRSGGSSSGKSSGAADRGSSLTSYLSYKPEVQFMPVYLIQAPGRARPLAPPLRRHAGREDSETHSAESKFLRCPGTINCQVLGKDSKHRRLS